MPYHCYPMFVWVLWTLRESCFHIPTFGRLFEPSKGRQNCWLRQYGCCSDQGHPTSSDADATATATATITITRRIMTRKILVKIMVISKSQKRKGQEEIEKKKSLQKLGPLVLQGTTCFPPSHTHWKCS